MKIQMLKHSGMLESQTSSLFISGGLTDPELQWRAWMQTESKNRYVFDTLLL